MTASSLLRGAIRSSIGVLLAVGAALTVAGCNTAEQKKEQKKVEVTVTTPILSDVVDYQDFTGRVDAYKTVDIRPRASGYVTSVPFKEGDVVQEGQLLFQIDTQTYEADFNLADANLELAKADASLQGANLTRARRAYETRGISVEDYQTAQATEAKSRATVIAAQAARIKAKLYLDYTHVTAPLTGRVSRRFVDPGNLVMADMTLLTTIVTETPVYVYFDVDERSYLDLKWNRWSLGAGLGARVTAPPEFKPKVFMRVANEEKYNRMGFIDFLDNRVNGNTGTLRMRGVFDNSEGSLTPGLFARIRMPTGKPYKRVLIPDEAVQTDQGKKFVYLVNDKNEVVRKDDNDGLVLGPAIEKLRVVKITDDKGQPLKNALTEKDQVVKVGMQRVKPKQPVDVLKEKPAEKPKTLLDQMNPRKEEK